MFIFNNIYQFNLAAVPTPTYTYAKSFEVSKMELFPEKVNSFQSLAIFVKNYILNVRESFGHTFDLEETQSHFRYYHYRHFPAPLSLLVTF